MIGPEQSARQACAKTILFLKSLNGRDLPAYLVQSAHLHAHYLMMAMPPEPSPPKARPIFQTAVTLSHFAACAFFILAGLAGVSMNVPPIGLAMTGAIWLFPAAASAALTWQHWRLAAALKALAKARGAL
jgi:hypothetical protein